MIRLTALRQACRRATDRAIDTLTYRPEPVVWSTAAVVILVVILVATLRFLSRG